MIIKNKKFFSNSLNEVFERHIKNHRSHCWFQARKYIIYSILNRSLNKNVKR